jgi:hypothetical protein
LEPATELAFSFLACGPQGGFMQDKHTPGPWRIGKDYGAVVADHPVPEVHGSDHVEAYGGHMVGESIAHRNRPLIAAAPELLNALRSLVALYDTDEGCRSTPEYIAARAAIAKATGSTL